jgi:hypothetical protein
LADLSAGLRDSLSNSVSRDGVARSLDRGREFVEDVAAAIGPVERGQLTEDDGRRDLTGRRSADAVGDGDELAARVDRVLVCSPGRTPCGSRPRISMMITLRDQPRCPF